MLLAAVVLGALALYYFGLRAGAWAAGATLVLCILALLAPRYATAIYAFIAAGAHRHLARRLAPPASARRGHRRPPHPPRRGPRLVDGAGAPRRRPRLKQSIGDRRRP